jgi:hypothetical protein
LGRKVAELINKEMGPGKYKTQFIGNRLSSGIYFYKLTACELSRTRKLILLK